MSVAWEQHAGRGQRVLVAVNLDLYTCDEGEPQGGPEGPEEREGEAEGGPEGLEEEAEGGLEGPEEA